MLESFFFNKYRRRAGALLLRLALLERGARVMTSPSLRRSEALRNPSWRRSETRVVGDGTRVSRALPTRPCLHASTCPCASPHACPYACTHRCARKTLSGTVNLRSVGRPFPFGEGEGAGGRDFWHMYASGHVHAHMLARVSLPILDLFALERVFFMVMVRTCVRGVGCGGRGGR